MKKSSTCIRTAVVIGVVGAATLPPTFAATGSKAVGTLAPKVVIAATCADLRSAAFASGEGNLEKLRADALASANQAMNKAVADERAAATPEARAGAASARKFAEKAVEAANALPIVTGKSASVKAAEANMLAAKTDDEKLAAHRALKAAESASDANPADPSKAGAAEAMMAASAEPTVRDGMMVGEMLKESAGEVAILDKSMEALRSAWDALGPYPDSHIGNRDYAAERDLVKAREKLADCALEAFEGAYAHYEILQKVAAKDALTRTALARFRELKRDYLYIAQREVYDKAQLAIYAGPSLSLNGDDKFKTGVEAAVAFEGGAGSLLGVGRVFTDITYRTKGSVDVASRANATGAVPPPNANDLFRSDKGYLRFNVGASTKISSDDRYALFTVAGVSTIPGVGGDFPQALRPRYGLGIRGQTFLSDGAYSRLSLSVAHDEYWRQPQGANATNIVNAYERGVIEALVLLPNAGSSGVATSARLTLDTPLDGKGPSEVRLSVLAAFSFEDFFKKILAAGVATPK